jgi:xylan 1,4-beta-xylosidase
MGGRTSDCPATSGARRGRGSNRTPASPIHVNRGLGRVALGTSDGFVSVDQNREVSIRRATPGRAETFQWIETFDGDLTLMSLVTNRYLQVDSTDGRIVVDSPGPRPDGQDGVRLRWRIR